MASEKNLNAVFTDIANSIRNKKGTTGTIQPVNMASEIDSIETGSTEKSFIYKGLEAMGTNWDSAFYCYGGAYVFQNMTTIKDNDIPDASNVLSMYQMFRYCKKLTSVPFMNTSKLGNASYMFHSCESLTTIPSYDFSNVYNMEGIFGVCSKLEFIYIKNIKADFYIDSTKLQHDALVELINNGLATITNTRTLTMGSSKLALLSDSEKQVALNKGWTLA